MSEADHYTTLGIARDATIDDIKKAFRKLARECHPDVAGDDPRAAERFTKVREAYEVLVDPQQRARYDRRGQRRSRSYGPDGFRMPGGFWSGTGFSSQGGPAPGGSNGKPNSRTGRGFHHNDLDLEDIFGDFSDAGPTRTTPGGYRYTGGRPASSGPINPEGRGNPGQARGNPGPPPDPSDFGFGRRPGTGQSSPPPNQQDPWGSGAPRQPGRDIALQVDVPESIARKGGVVTLHYPRLRLGDDGRSVFRYDEIHDLKVPPGTKHGDTLRAERYGDAGTDGTIGDLVCDIRVVREWGTEESSGPAPADDPSIQVLRVPVSISEALLGGRIEVETPGGKLRLTLPPCLRAGGRLRLKGRGEAGADLYVEPFVALPGSLDEESRQLIERFAELNPYDPRTP